MSRLKLVVAHLQQEILLAQLFLQFRHANAQSLLDVTPRALSILIIRFCLGRCFGKLVLGLRLGSLDLMQLAPHFSHLGVALTERLVAVAQLSFKIFYRFAQAFFLGVSRQGVRLEHFFLLAQLVLEPIFGALSSGFKPMHLAVKFGDLRANGL